MNIRLNIPKGIQNTLAMVVVNIGHQVRVCGYSQSFVLCEPDLPKLIRLALILLHLLIGVASHSHCIIWKSGEMSRRTPIVAMPPRYCIQEAVIVASDFGLVEVLIQQQRSSGGIWLVWDLAWSVTVDLGAVISSECGHLSHVDVHLVLRFWYLYCTISHGYVLFSTM